MVQNNSQHLLPTVSESKGRRFSKRLAEKKKLRSDENAPIPTAPPPPPLPTSSKVKVHVTSPDKTAGPPNHYNKRLRTPLKDVNSQVCISKIVL